MYCQKPGRNFCWIKVTKKERLRGRLCQCLLVFPWHHLLHWRLLRNTCVSLPASFFQAWEHVLPMHGQAVRELRPQEIALSHFWLGIKLQLPCPSVRITLRHVLRVSQSEIPSQIGLRDPQSDWAAATHCSNLIDNTLDFLLFSVSLSHSFIVWNHFPNKLIILKSLS